MVAYDVPEDRRRQRIADLLEGYGRRVQYSVFECVLARAQYNELRTLSSSRRIRREEDSVRIYPLSAQARRQTEVWGGPPLAEVPGSTVV